MFELSLTLYQVRPWHYVWLVQGATYVRSRAERTMHFSFAGFRSRQDD